MKGCIKEWDQENNSTGSIQEPAEPYFFCPGSGNNWQDLLF
jgi:hypothetical protein